MERQSKHGSTIENNHPPALSSNAFFRFTGEHNGKPSSFGVSEELIDKHTLLIGSTGCGKTTLLNAMISQIQDKMTENDVMIIFDSKGDFYREFWDDKKSVVIGNSEPYYSLSARWNIFKEICADGWVDRKSVV